MSEGNGKRGQDAEGSYRLFESKRKRLGDEKGREAEEGCRLLGSVNNDSNHDDHHHL